VKRELASIQPPTRSGAMGVAAVAFGPQLRILLAVFTTLCVLTPIKSLSPAHAQNSSSSSLPAQDQNSPTSGFKHQSFTYQPWIKGRFTEVVTVKNPGKWIFLAGIGSESEGNGNSLSRRFL
jgi:hypothetical protein